MSLSKWQGIAPNTAKWEACPERATYFLELLVIEKENKKLVEGGLRKPTCEMLAERFWERFRIYHTNEQFKNHFKNKKKLWNLICRARKSTGIGFNNDTKEITASDEWWTEHKSWKGLLQLKNKQIADYDLLEKIFGAHRAATGENMEHAFNIDEGSGDSDKTIDEGFHDPLVGNQSQGTESNYDSSGSKRKASSSNAPKKKKNAWLSPCKKVISMFFQEKDKHKEKSDYMNISEPYEHMNDSMQFAHGSANPSVGSQPSIKKCIDTMLKVHKISSRSDLYRVGVNVFSALPDLMVSFLAIDDEEEQLDYLRFIVDENKHIRPGTMSKDPPSHQPCDLNFPPYYPYPPPPDY